MVRHRKIHSGGEKEWKCSHCNFAFWEKSDLIRHIKSHEGNRPFKCDFCDQTFVWRRYLYKHLKNNHTSEDRHFCQDCCKCFPTEDELEEHDKSEHSNKKSLTHTCDVCGMEFHFKYKLDEHMYQHTGRKANECDRCSLRFISRKELDRHMADHALEVSFSCNTCKKAFSNVEELQKHLRLHVGNTKFSCPICQVSFRWKSQLTNHMVVHSDDHDFTCTICQKEFKRKRDLTRHVKIFHDTKPPYTCTDCKLDFHSPFNLHQHKSETHWKKQDALEDYFACTRCSGLFRIKSDLQKHMAKVHPPRPYICTLCAKKFTFLKFLEKHFELKHEGTEMIENLNYEIRPQKEGLVAELILDGKEITVEETIQNGVDELQMAIESAQEDGRELDHIYAGETVSHETTIDESESKVVVVQNVDGSEIETSVQQPVAMSEAITLAQFSQQASSGGVIPVFVKENSQQQTIQSPVKSEQNIIQNVSTIVAGAFKSQESIVTRTPQVIKISRPLENLQGSLVPHPVALVKMAPNSETSDTPQKGIPQIKIITSEGAQRLSQLTPIKAEPGKIMIVRVPSKAVETVKVPSLETVEENMQTDGEQGNLL